MNELTKKVKAMSKGLTKDLIDKFCIFNGAKYFSFGIFQNYLLFIPTKNCIGYFTSATAVESQKYNGMLEESIENVTKLHTLFAPTFFYHHFLPDMNLNGHFDNKWYFST